MAQTFDQPLHTYLIQEYPDGTIRITSIRTVSLEETVEWDRRELSVRGSVVSEAQGRNLREAVEKMFRDYTIAALKETT